MATAGTIIWTTPPQLLTPVGVENHAEEPFSRIQIPAAATTPSGRPWFTLTAFQACQVCSTPPLPFCQKPHCAIAFTHTHLVLSFVVASPLPLVGPFILAPEPQGTPQTAHQGPFAFASPVRTLTAWLMYCERDTCLLVSLPALHPLPAYHRSSPPRSLMVTSNAERRKCPTVTRLRCTQMVFEK